MPNASMPCNLSERITDRLSVEWHQITGLRRRSQPFDTQTRTTKRKHVLFHTGRSTARRCDTVDLGRSAEVQAGDDTGDRPVGVASRRDHNMYKTAIFDSNLITPVASWPRSSSARLTASSLPVSRRRLTQRRRHWSVFKRRSNWPCFCKQLHITGQRRVLGNERDRIDGESVALRAV